MDPLLVCQASGLDDWETVEKEKDGVMFLADTHKVFFDMKTKLADSHNSGTERVSQTKPLIYLFNHGLTSKCHIWLLCLVCDISCIHSFFSTRRRLSSRQ